MNAAVADDTCFHCGAPLPVGAVHDDDNSHHYCCAGCAAAARWIHAAELGDYYRLRSVVSARVDPTPLDMQLWDRPELQREHAEPVPGGWRMTLLTDGMRCAACAWLIDRALSRLDGVLDVTANAVTGRLRIDWDPARIRLSEILTHLLRLGYRPYLAAGLERERARAKERKRWLLRLGVAGLGAMQAMMLAEALYLDFDQQMPTATRDFFRWLTFLLATPVVFYSGWPFLAGMARELRTRHVGMDTLIASSVLLAYVASLFETIRGGMHVWYDAAVMFVFLLLAARMLEQRARNAATAQVDALARARPAFAIRERADGARESVPVAELNAGDVVWMAAGDSAPADGVLLDAPAQFEEALLTGESHPLHKQPGDAIYAGTHAQHAPARMRITCTGAQTRLSQLTRLVEQAQSHRPRLAQQADRLGARFVAGLLLVAGVVWLIWHWYAPERAFDVALSLLVISCPCALSLAVPTALAAAHGALAKLGVLVTRPDALDTLAQATDVVFDKTGTLSTAEPEVEEMPVEEPLSRLRERVPEAGEGATAQRARAVAFRASAAPSPQPLSQRERGSKAVALAVPLSQRERGSKAVALAVPLSPRERGLCLHIAAALERDIHHPIAAAFATADSGLPVTDSRTIPGLGVEGRIHGQLWKLGQRAFAAAQADPASDDSLIWLGDGEHPHACFRLHESARPDAAATLAALRMAGLTLHLASGDAEAPVTAFAERLGIENVHARQTPQHKLDHVRALQAQGRIVAMVGDGLNDAPVLAGADVSIAMGEGAALAQRAADLVLTGSTLMRIPQAIHIARRSRRIIRQNLAWALGYNLIAIPLAAFGQVTPWVAALGMALSSLMVTGNALRLTRLPQMRGVS